MTANPIARTSYGDAEGEWSEGVARFRGLPYADRIDGAGRFQPARPPARWNGVREARTWAPLTPQGADEAVVRDGAYHRYLFGPFYETPISEEGLFLNLWTPSLDASAKRPVMVWLHGGGFAVGTPTRPRDEASRLSAHGDMVVVAPNHRLGAFGYLYREPDGAPAIPPNLGLTDIVAALRWVAENVAAFGGDPDNVTVFWESGGAMKTAALLSMPSARGLFHRAICMAGVFAKGYLLGPMTRVDADAASKALMHRVGVGDDFAALAKVPMQDLISAQEQLAGGAMSWRPVVDGEILPCDPAEALIGGTDLDVPVIVGWARHEADFIFRGLPLTVAQLDTMMGDRGRRLFDAYTAARPGASGEDIVEAILTDWIFGMPSIAFAEARAASGHKTYVYQMAWGRPDDSSARATHATDTPFVFDRRETMGFTQDAPDGDALSTAMQNAWIGFARGGDPGAQWPQYAPPHRAMMVFDSQWRIVEDLKRAERDAWGSEFARP